MLASPVPGADASISDPHQVSLRHRDASPSFDRFLSASRSNGAVAPTALPGSAGPSIKYGVNPHYGHVSPSLLLTQSVPRSSILLNAKRTTYKGLIIEPAIYETLNDDVRPAPVVKRISAVPSSRSKDKEREREREREKERQREKEREKLKSKADERIWGIPKKALFLGLGDLNFNAQVAMLGGWGHGSGTVTNLGTPAGSSSSPALVKSSLPAPASDGRRSKDISSVRSGASDGRDHKDEADVVVDSEDRMDPEELASLNAIINTRRSMAAAQALVNGQITFSVRSARAGSQGSSTSTGTRPTLADLRAGSQDSVPSMSSTGQTVSSVDSASGNLSSLAKPEAAVQTQHLLSSDSLGGVGSVGLSGSLLATSPSKQARIRFAPLPQAFGPMTGDGIHASSGTDASMAGDASDITVGSRAATDAQGHHQGLSRFDGNASEDTGSDSDYDSDASSSGKGKWYLMGMPSSVFKADTYNIKRGGRRRGTHSKTSSFSGISSDEIEKKDAAIHRRKSTGSVSEIFSQELIKKGWSRESGLGSASSDKDEEDRGRKAGRPRPKSRPSSSSRKSNRSSSRNGARGSGDEDERARRRELIRLARPGGTGMVTLADGTKIRARRVNDPVFDTEELDFNEWGYAGLAKEASRRSISAQLGTSLEQEDVEDDGSGMAWVRRRRREREEKARREEEEARLAETRKPTAEAAAIEEAETIRTTETQAAIAAAGLVTTQPGLKPRFEDVDLLDHSASRHLETDAEITKAALASVDGEAGLLSAMAGSMGVVAPAFEAVKSIQASELTAIEQQRPEPPVGSSETASMSGSGFLNRLESRVGDKASASTAGLALTAGQAEEIRRRHEKEVYALGAEVLAQNRRNAQRRASSKNPAGQPTASPPAHPARASRSDAVSGAVGNSQPGSRIASKSGSREASRDGRRIDDLQPLSSLSKAFLPNIRKATGDSERTVSVRPAGAEDSSQVVKAHDIAAMTIFAEEPVMTLSPSSSLAEMRTEPTARIDHGNASKQSSVGLRSSPLSSGSTPYMTLRGSASQASNLSVQNSSRGPSHSPSARHAHVDPSVSVPAPSPWLPRRPDARGLSVVPLPQLGVRPERPREGRVWQYDDTDESSESESEQSGVAIHDQIRSNADSDDDDLNAEELEEEERKTAMQKKRATTRAAGQEVVHSRSVGAETKARMSREREPTKEKKVRAKVKKIKSSSTSSLRPEKPRPTATGRYSRASRSFSKVSETYGASAGGRAALHDEDEDSDEDLWPADAASASSKFGTPKPRHILVNLPGGPGIWDSNKGGGANAVAAINSVAAARAKAIKKRAQKQKAATSRDTLELPENWDDEMMDYGWPRSLKGSLY